MKEQLAEAKAAAISYKALLVKGRDDLSFCQSRHAAHKRMLASTNNFYLYLLKGLATVGDGIRHQKLVGEKLRWEDWL